MIPVMNTYVIYKLSLNVQNWCITNITRTITYINFRNWNESCYLQNVALSAKAKLQCSSINMILILQHFYSIEQNENWP